MPQLVPVEGNPFETEEAEGLDIPKPATQADLPSGLQPVEGNPFEESRPTGLVPVEGNPFADESPPTQGSVADLEENRPNAVQRGLVSGLLEQNPTLTAHALEGAAEFAPEAVGGTLRNVAGQLREYAKLKPEEYKLVAPRLSEIDGFDDALTFAGELFGQGIASAAPSVVMGTAGAFSGGALAGPFGAAVGAVSGAVVPSTALNYGEAVAALKEAGVENRRAAELGAYIAPALVGLDVVSVGPIIGKLGGITAVKREVARGIVRRILAEGGKGATREGLTEATQEAIQEATVALETDQPFWDADRVEGLATAFIGGALAGGGLGSVAGLPTDVEVGPTTQEAPTEETILEGLPESAVQEETQAERDRRRGESVAATLALEEGDLQLSQAETPLEDEDMGTVLTRIRRLLEEDKQLLEQEGRKQAFEEGGDLFVFETSDPAEDGGLGDGIPRPFKGVAPEDPPRLVDATGVGIDTLAIGTEPIFEGLKGLTNVFQQFALDTKISRPMDVIFTYNPSKAVALGRAMTIPYKTDPKGPSRVGRYAIVANLGNHNVSESVDLRAQFYSTLAHEFGHILHRDRFASAPAELRTAIQEAYMTWLQGTHGQDVSYQDARTSRDAFLSADNPFVTERSFARNWEEIRASGDLGYWLSFDEWMAEQVARYATTDEQALTRVDKYFAKLGKAIRELYQRFLQYLSGLLRQEPPKQILEVDPYQGRATEAVRNWVEYTLQTNPSLIAQATLEANERSRKKNQAAFNRAGEKYVSAVPRTASSEPARVIGERLLGKGNFDVELAGASEDRFNWFMKYFIGLTQLRDANPHIAPLQRLTELWQLKQLERAEIMNSAVETVKAWEQVDRASPGQSDAMTGMLDDYMHMEYLSNTERRRKVVRKPTPGELAELARSNGVNNAGVAIFNRVIRDFDMMLNRYEQQRRSDVNKLRVPQARVEANQRIDREIANLRRQPYVPAMRFGDYTITVRDIETREVLDFQTFETKRNRDKAFRDIKAQIDDSMSIQAGVLSKDAGPLVGMPPGLLDSIEEKLELSPDQKEALDQLKFDFAPTRSFKHRFRKRKRTPGYSKDFRRAYANYMFHGSNYFVRVKYVDQLREQVNAIKESARDLQFADRRLQIYNFANDHLNYTLDPKPDFMALRAGITGWVLGFSPAAATLNLSQMFIGTMPFLSSKFGDVKAIRQMIKSGGDLTSYYRKATLEKATDTELWALSEGIKEGVITEAMAPELAAHTSEDNLNVSIKSKPRQFLHFALDKGMKMFQLTEQMNRRITFRAAFQLAINNPEAKYVRDSKKKHSLQYNRILEQKNPNIGPREAAAFVAAKDAVESTQFIYQQYAQPRFMRGKLRTLFVFKSFLQNTLFMLWNYPTAAARSFLVLGFLGGAMAVPGAEDLRDLIRAVAYQLFGKDFDIELEARRTLVEMLEMTSFKNSRHEIADVLLLGTGRVGFGIPALLQRFGVPWPETSRSAAVSLGQISPVDFGELFGPKKDIDRAISQNVQRASGAAFGVGFNMYRALSDLASGEQAWNDFRAWEKAMPRELAAASKAYRAFTEGRERSSTGTTVIKYDSNDTLHLAEIVAQGLGYQPTRLAREWDRIIATSEAINFWNIKRRVLFRQYDRALQLGDQEAIRKVRGAIRDFNKNLPKEARLKRITADALRRSARARTRQRAAAENRTTVIRSDRPIARGISSLFPRGSDAEVIDVKRER